jgi:polar amino acid transport system permease protein
MANVPWWVVIIVLVGAYLAYSMLSNEEYVKAFRFILPGVKITLQVTIAAYGLALVIGLIAGLMRVSKNPVLYAASTLYVEVIRGLPILVILLYAGYVISPAIRDATNRVITFSDLQEGIIGLAIGYGAYLAEVYRAGIQSIHRGQMEASRSLGMTYMQAMRYVILPQAIRRILPPLGNDFIAMLKDSSLIALLAIPELLQMGRLFVSRTFRAFEGYNSVAVLYLSMTLCLSALVRLIERRWSIE